MSVSKLHISQQVMCTLLCSTIVGLTVFTSTYNSRPACQFYQSASEQMLKNAVSQNGPGKLNPPP